MTTRFRAMPKDAAEVCDILERIIPDYDDAIKAWHQYLSGERVPALEAYRAAIRKEVLE